MEYILESLVILLNICFWIVFYVNQKQRRYIKKIEPLAEKWLAVLRQRDEMIKNGTWDVPEKTQELVK